MNSEPDQLTHAQRAALRITPGDRERASRETMPARPDPVDRRPRISTQRDAFNLLGYIAAFDSRERGEFEAQAWLDALGPQQIAVDDAKRAVVAYFNGPSRHRWITPGDVIEQIEEGV